MHHGDVRSGRPFTLLFFLSAIFILKWGWVIIQTERQLPEALTLDRDQLQRGRSLDVLQWGSSRRLTEDHGWPQTFFFMYHQRKTLVGVRKGAWLTVNTRQQISRTFGLGRESTCSSVSGPSGRESLCFSSMYSRPEGRGILRGQNAIQQIAKNPLKKGLLWEKHLKIDKKTGESRQNF